MEGPIVSSSFVRSRVPAVVWSMVLLPILVLALPTGSGAQQTSAAGALDQGADPQVVQAIMEEGMDRSQAMEHVVWLADIHGPRLTGSPGFEGAAAWVQEQLEEWGLSDVREERFEFGRGWSLDRFSAHMIEPQIQPLIGMPRSWTEGTGGPVTAEVVYAPILDEADFERYRGELEGKIVLAEPPRVVNLLEGRVVLRMNEDEIREAQTIEDPRGGSNNGGGRPDAGAATAPEAPTPPGQMQVREFYRAEGVLAVLERGPDSDVAPGGSDLSWTTQRTDGGTVFVTAGGSRDPSVEPGLPQVVVAVEHYNRMVRILERDIPLRMELDIRTRFHDEDPNRPWGANIIAEIPGTDPELAHEVVLLGAHLDSHHGATGATDNATGVAAMMEAMRILQAVDAQPRRTIRVALWGAEEQGLLGAREYVERHLVDGDRPRPAFEEFSAYYNLDNGTGRVRGIWLEGFAEAGAVFEDWMTLPQLAQLGVEIVGPRAVGATDHAAFARVGLPGFQFIQERLEYRSRTHHSNMDVVDRVQEEDLRQAATVAAIFAYLTAQRDERIPRR
jgi:carboxypeptidase Q